MQLATLCAALLALGCALPVLSGSPDLYGFATPVVFWGGSDNVISSQMTVNYQVTDTVQLLKTLAPGQAAGKDAIPQLREAIKSASDKLIVFVGNQLDTSSLRKASVKGSLTQLGEVFSDSKSAVLVPYAKFEGSSIVDSVGSIAKEAGLSYEVVGCEAEQDLAQATKSALSSGADVVVVCASKNGQEQSPAGVQAELIQLVSVKKAVAEQDARARFVYTAQPPHSTVVQRRSLLGYKGFGPYTACGPLCQTQVRWLEGMLAVIVMALATCAGLTCLYVLDTPSRFEVQKEGASS